jgi:putative FmdB family regulatory protein
VGDFLPHTLLGSGRACVLGVSAAAYNVRFCVKGLAMPIYAYRCQACGHAKDVLQKLSDPVLSTCPACGAEAFTKQVTAAGFQLKGSGWYATDFKGSGSKPPAADTKAEGAGEAKAAGSGDGKADGKSAAPAGAPAAAPAATAAAPAAAAPAAPAGGAGH